MKSEHPLWRGALILTAAGFASRLIGFFYRIFLSQAIGAEGVGLYQLVFPVYATAFSLTASGIQTAISRHVSARIARKDHAGARNILSAGLILSFGLSLACALIVNVQADFIAVHLLMEPRCASLLRIIAWAAPFGCIHSCLHGYFYALKRADVPALSQLIEQLSRIAASYLIFCLFLEKGLTPTPILAAGGMVAGELVSTFFTVGAFLFREKPLSGRRIFPDSQAFSSIFSMAAPLTLNRTMLNLLHSVEAACIPWQLQRYGLTSSEALSLYGVLTGMAMPLVLFPSAITNALSTMLLPSVSEDLSLDKTDNIRRTVERTIGSSLWLGIFCTGAFLLTGEKLGNLLFHSPEVGPFILVLAWLCPFLYLGATMTSILNGMGKTLLTFFQHMASLILRILFVCFAIPVYGILGYLWGMLASELLLSFLTLVSLYRGLHFQIQFRSWIICPCAAMTVSAGVYLFFTSLLNLLESHTAFSLPEMIGLILNGSLMAACFFFFMYQIHDE
ncbi:MAG: polysaccharide biosynthesis protein [Candidatus Limivivens sp.]|nr:polysaccharide biosynthesis protein [Candidatus Limivivens sp.]